MTLRKSVRQLLVFSCTLSIIFNACSKHDVAKKPTLVGPEIQTLTALPGYTGSDSYVSNGYVGLTSYFDNDSIEVYLSATKVIRNARLGLYTAAGIVVDYIYLDSITPQAITTAKPYEQGYGYQIKFKYKPSFQLLSGVYQISKKIPVLIKNSTPANQVLVVYASNTVNAYNKNGGGGMYSSPRLPITSFLRPAPLFKFSNEFVKWNDTQYAFDYVSDLELDDYANMQNYKLIVLTGHSEYWTRQARLNFDRFISEGKHALLLTGNNMWWQVRYSDDKTQLICYKSASTDPIADPLLKTAKWTTTSLKYPIIPSIGADFINGGYGQRIDSGWNGFKILAPNSPLLTGTNLNKYDIVSCSSQEYDGSYVIRNPDQDPILDSAKLKAYRSELIGYDLGVLSKTTVHTFMVYQPTATSGIIVNTASTNWGHTFGFAGPSGPTLKLITKNAIELLMTDQPVFSPADVEEEPTAR